MKMKSLKRFHERRLRRRPDAPPSAGPASRRHIEPCIVEKLHIARSDSTERVEVKLQSPQAGFRREVTRLFRFDSESRRGQ